MPEEDETPTTGTCIHCTKPIRMENKGWMDDQDNYMCYARHLPVEGHEPN